MMCTEHPRTGKSCCQRPGPAARVPGQLSRGTLIFWLPRCISLVLAVSILGGCQKKQQSGGWVVPSESQMEEDRGLNNQDDVAASDEFADEPDEFADEEPADTPASSRDDAGSDPAESAAESPSSQEPTDAKPRQRPEEVSQWIPEDFTSAWREDDPMLAEAVTYLGQKSVGDSKVVPLLVGLLVVEKAPEPESDPQNEDEESSSYDPDEELDVYSTGDIQASEGVVQAVIQALGRNNTPQALSVLKELLLGRRQAPIPPRDLVTEVLKALAIQINAEKENILFVLLTKPEQITTPLAQAASKAGGQSSSRRSGDDELDPEWLQEEVLTEAAPKTSIRFRARMAKFLEDPNVPAETAEPFEEFLARNDPRNMAAQIILYGIASTEAQTIEQIERTLTENSRQALRQLLGMSAATEGNGQGLARPSRGRPRARRPSRRSSRRSSRRDELDDELLGDEPAAATPQVTDPVELVRVLWTPQVVDSLKVTAPNASDEQADRNSRGPLLLTTIPLSNARVKLGTLLQQGVSKSPDPWTSMGLFGNELVDPALLVLVKEALQSSGAPRRSTRSRRTSSRYDDSGGESDADQWQSTVETFVADLCSQLQSAAGGGGASEENVSPADRLPVRLHRGANVVARLHVRWPEQLDQRWASLPIAPLDLHYVRMEEEGRPRTVVSTYTRLLTRAQKHELSGGGMWLDELNRRQRRSIDIRVTSESGDLGLGATRRDRGGTRNNEPVSYVIEVLSVAIRAPETTPQAAKPAATQTGAG